MGSKDMNFMIFCLEVQFRENASKVYSKKNILLLT